MHTVFRDDSFCVLVTTTTSCSFRVSTYLDARNFVFVFFLSIFTFTLINIFCLIDIFYDIHYLYFVYFMYLIYIFFSFFRKVRVVIVPCIFERSDTIKLLVAITI